MHECGNTEVGKLAMIASGLHTNVTKIISLELFVKIIKITKPWLLLYYTSHNGKQ